MNRKHGRSGKHSGLRIIILIVAVLIVFRCAPAIVSNEKSFQWSESYQQAVALYETMDKPRVEPREPLFPQADSSQDAPFKDAFLPTTDESQAGAEPTDVPDSEVLATDEDVDATVPEEQAAIPTPTGELEMTMLNVEQGLSILLRVDDDYMIYDGGGRSTSSYVVSYLKKHEITHLKYLVASHYDEDHIAGLVGVLNTTEVEISITPDYEADTNIYESFEEKLAANGCQEVHPQVGDTYELGEAIITVLGPTSYNSSDDNNNSVVVRIDYGEYSCLITGDAEEPEEEQLMAAGVSLDVDIYVAGHHGSKSSSSNEFLQRVTPEVVWISVGEDNLYGHPAAETMERLQLTDADMYRTDKQQEVSVVTDGSKVQYSTEACLDWSCGISMAERMAQQAGAASTQQADASDKAVAEKNQSSESAVKSYVLNTHTKKFHDPTCYDIDKMSDKNKAFVEDTRDSLIMQGYSACGHCNP